MNGFRYFLAETLPIM